MTTSFLQRIRGPGIPVSHGTRWIAGTILGLILAFSGFVALLWWIGLFDLPETDAGAKAFAAVIALLGGLFASVLTFVGVLLKLSFDARTLELQREAEERLKMDSCIRAMDLLRTPSSGEPSENQKAGSLLALANLGQIEFALTLLQRMWPSQEVSLSSAVWLINEGLKHFTARIQFQAASLLNKNAELLKSPAGDFEWPDHLSWQWQPDLDVYARMQIFEALYNCLKSNPPSQWNGNSQGRFIVFFHRMMAQDDHRWITYSAALILQVLLRTYRIDITNYWEDTLERERPITIDQIRESIAAKVEEAKTKALFINNWTYMIEAWAKSSG